MRLLVCLAGRAGEVVSIDELLTEVWVGVIVTSDSVYQAVASLRRTLGDDPKRPTYIATVPRLGYRMIAMVGVCDDQPRAPVSGHGEGDGGSKGRSTRGERQPRRPVRLLVAMAVALCLAGGGAYARRSYVTRAGHTGISIGVVPFLDLTEGMRQEYFADGMTEELIDKLSKIPGVRVAAPTSSFYLKGKQLSIADVAKTLDVAYVLDGSVRQSGAMVRVAARLIRAETGYVVWSETYDRPTHDLLMVQDEIAGEVAKALGRRQVGGQTPPAFGIGD
jgi:transcriptional activator of cad operon